MSRTNPFSDQFLIKSESRSSLGSVLASYQLREGYHGYFKKLPLEIFTKIMSNLNLESLIIASHVCESWRNTVLRNQRLWNNLEINLVNYEQCSQFEKTKIVTFRSKGELRSLSLGRKPDTTGMRTIDELFDIDGSEVENILKTIASNDGGKKISSIEVDFSDDVLAQRPNTCLSMIEELIHFSHYAASNLESLELSVQLEGIHIGSALTRAMPNLRVLKVIATSNPDNPDFDEVEEIPTVFDVFSNRGDPSLVESKLSEIYLAGVLLRRDFGSSTMNCLKSLKLFNVETPFLHSFLKRCSNSLEELVLVQVSTITELSAGVISFPSLKSIILSGNQSPNLFLPPQLGRISFIIETRALEKIEFGPTTTTHNEVLRTSPAFPFLSQQSLTIFFRLSISIKYLDLTGTELSDSILLESFKSAPSTLSTLILTRPASDLFIDSLHTLLPSLRVLKVQDSDITLPALARLAFNYQQSQPSTRRYLGDFEFSVTTKSRLPINHPSLISQTRTFHNLCLQLSKAQIENLINLIELNNPPISQTYEAIKKISQEFGGTKKVYTNISTTNEAIFLAAQDAMNLWQKLREEKWAIEWFESQMDVILSLQEFY